MSKKKRSIDIDLDLLPEIMEVCDQHGLSLSAFVNRLFRSVLDARISGNLGNHYFEMPFRVIPESAYGHYAELLLRDAIAKDETEEAFLAKEKANEESQNIGRVRAFEAQVLDEIKRAQSPKPKTDKPKETPGKPTKKAVAKRASRSPNSGRQAS